MGKADGADEVNGLRESIKGEWSGDVMGLLSSCIEITESS